MQLSLRHAPLLGLAALASLGLAALLPQAAHAQSGSLATTYAGTDKGRMGFYFTLTNLSATSNLTVSSFDVNANANQNVDVYYRDGSYVGNEGSAGWTLLESGGVTSNGAGNASALDVGGLTLTGGQKDSIYMFFNGASDSALYTDGSGTYSNSDLSIFSNEANYDKFDTAALANRIWNGTVNYTLTPATPAPEPASWAAFAFTGLVAAGLMLRARKRRAA